MLSSFAHTTKIIFHLTIMLVVTISHSYATSSNLLYLNLSNNTNQATDVCAVYMFDGASLGFDSEYDAYKFGNNSTAISTSSSENYELSINAIPYNRHQLEIPVVCYFEHHGSYEISFDGLSTFDSDVTLELYDSITGNSIIISGQTYIFDCEVIGKSSRFTLKITRKEDLNDIVGIQEQDLLQANVFPNPVIGNEFKITGPNMDATVTAVDINGSFVEIEEVYNFGYEKSFRFKTKPSAGSYLILIHLDPNQVLTRRIVVK